MARLLYVIGPNSDRKMTYLLFAIRRRRSHAKSIAAPSAAIASIPVDASISGTATGVTDVLPEPDPDPNQLKNDRIIPLLRIYAITKGPSYPQSQENFTQIPSIQWADASLSSEAETITNPEPN